MPWLMSSASPSARFRSTSTSTISLNRPPCMSANALDEPTNPHPIMATLRSLIGLDMRNPFCPAWCEAFRAIICVCGCLSPANGANVETPWCEPSRFPQSSEMELAWLEKGLSQLQGKSMLSLPFGAVGSNLAIWGFSDPLHKPQVTLALLDCRA